MNGWQRLRRTLLSVAMAIFALRVFGQIEVALLAPPALGPMCRWYSGLIPYPVLLPVQIGLLMAMTLVTHQHIVDRGGTIPRRRKTRLILIGAGAIYAAVMALRLVLALTLTDGDCGYGQIPIATHWALAGYIALLGLAPVKPAPVDPVAMQRNLPSRKNRGLPLREHVPERTRIVISFGGEDPPDAGRAIRYNCANNPDL